MKRPAILLAVAAALLMAAMIAKPALLALPSVPAQVGADQFDANRAAARLARILGDQRPHPVDSEANDLVRSRLVAELRAIGLEPVVTDTIDCNGTPRSRTVNCARVRNVRATLGPAAGRHVLLVSHYDSTPVGPGAADDGIGVAVMLEMASLLRERRLARPITFLFDEGEEAGLNGARAFLRRDPIAARVDAAINLEARGVTGPAIMFETSRPNGAAVSLLQRSAWRPVANSLTGDFYALIPNDTDVSVFRDRGWTILNFAIIGNETRYHSPGDTIAALDRRSLRHMGVQAMRAATSLAEAAPAPGGDRAYADVLGRAIVSMPAALALAGLALLLLLFAGVGFRRGSRLGTASATVVAAIVLAALAAFVFQLAVSLLRGGIFWRAHPWVIAAAVDLTATTAAVLVLSRVRGIERYRLRPAFWLVFLLIGAGLCVVAPGAAIYFLAPPALAIAAALVGRRPTAAQALALLAWLALFLSWAPLLHLSEILLDFHSAWIFAALSALIQLPLLIELKPLLDRSRGSIASAAIAVPALAAWAALLLLPAYSADRRQAFGIEYVRDGAGAWWAVANDGRALPARFGRFEKGVKVAWSTRRRWAASAPLVPDTAIPRLELISSAATPLGRRVRLRLHASGYDSLLLRTEADSPLVAVRAAGAIARFGRGKAKEAYALRCHGRSCDGLVADLLVAGGRPVAARLIGIGYRLPALARPLVAARPADAAPQYLPDATIAVRDVRL